MAKTEHRRVERLHREWKKARAALDEFIEEYEDIIEQYSVLANDVNVRMQKLKMACRETGMGAGPLEVSIQRRRVFDGRFLYDHFSDRRDIQQALVEVQFKVNTDNFDHLVQAGEIQPDEAAQAVLEIKTSNRVLHAPPDIVVG
jgi:hypothetical protein